MPHVHFVLDHIEPYYGMERATTALMTELIAGGCDVTASVTRGPVEELHRLGVAVSDRPPLEAGYLSRSLRVLRFRRPTTATVVVPVGVWTAIPWLLRSRRARAGTIVWEHSLIEEKVASARSLRILSRLARRLYVRAEAVVVVSPPLEESVRRLDPRIRTDLIPNIVPTSSPPPSPRAQGTRLVCVASLTAVKNQEVAVRALRALPPEVTLDLYGDGPERPSLEACAAAEGVADRTTFHGRVSPTEVHAAMAGASCLVHPAAGETFGMVFLEAANARLPVVAASNRLTRWLIPEYVPGALYTGDEHELADTVLRVLAEPPEAEVWMSAEARRGEVLDARVVTRAWLALIDKISSDPQPTR